MTAKMAGERYPFIDAIRISDGQMVGLKHVEPSDYPYETEITRYFGNEELLKDPRNHCVPLIEILEPPGDIPAFILVMPFLRQWNDPPLLTVGEAMDFISQMLEGLLFVHEHHVVHRDPTLRNWMLDPKPLYPNMFHPVKKNRNLNFKGKAKHNTRTACPTRYILIDFGLSRQYDASSFPVTEDPVLGGDKTAPEFFKDGVFQRDQDPFDPFPTDVYYAGNLIRQHLIKKYTGLDFLAPFVVDLVHDDPVQRPTMKVVVERFQSILLTLSTMKLRSRIRRRKEFVIVSLFKSIGHIIRTANYIARGIPPIPTPRGPS